MAEDDEDPDEDEAEGPRVPLGEGPAVEGAPLARVASRLTWPQEKSEIVRKEGETAIRTPDGPRQLAEVMDGVDTSYFGRRQDFLEGVRRVIGTGPVPTE